MKAKLEQEQTEETEACFLSFNVQPFQTKTKQFTVDERYLHEFGSQVTVGDCRRNEFFCSELFTRAALSTSRRAKAISNQYQFVDSALAGFCILL